MISIEIQALLNVHPSVRSYKILIIVCNVILTNFTTRYSVHKEGNYKKSSK